MSAEMAEKKNELTGDPHYQYVVCPECKVAQPVSDGNPRAVREAHAHYSFVVRDDYLAMVARAFPELKFGKLFNADAGFVQGQ